MNKGIGIVFIAIALLILAFADDIHYALSRMWRFQRRRLGLDLGRFRRPFKRRKQPQVDLTEIRDFAVSLQLAISLEETLSGALARTAEQFSGRGFFGERLKRHVESKLAISPEEVIRGLAEEFGSEELRDLLTKLDLARDGGVSCVEALSVSVNAIEEEIRAGIERDIQRAPIVLTIPMVLGVFFVSIVLSLWPLISSMLRTLQAY